MGLCEPPPRAAGAEGGAGGVPPPLGSYENECRALLLVVDNDAGAKADAVAAMEAIKRLPQNFIVEITIVARCEFKNTLQKLIIE